MEFHLPTPTNVTPPAPELLSERPGEATTASVLTTPKVPSGTWRMLSGSARTKALPKGLDVAWAKLVSGVQLMVPRQRMFLERARRVLALDDQLKDISDARLREQAHEMRDKFRLGRQTKQDVERAFAVVREVAWRQLGMKPYLVQVAAALAIDAGCITELATGEGKTLTATMPATIAGWRGRGCHVMTVNDYLAERDAKEMGKVYRFCGLTAKYVTGQMSPMERKAAYAADVTYLTNKESTADFLRDRLALGRQQGLCNALLGKIVDGQGGGADRLIMRGIEFGIIDEADSILIDEAVTPLIISGGAPNKEQVEAFQTAAGLARELTIGEHYTIDHRYREINFTYAGREKLADLCDDLGGIWAGVRRREEMVNQALTALHLYTLGKQYVIQEGKIVIVDEFTGRLMPDRTWRDGLHQAVEAKEGVEVQPMKQTLARVSFQRFFRLYRKLGGMTGTAWEGRFEFWQIYNRPTVRIPTNRPCIRIQTPTRVFLTADAKWNAIVEEIQKIHALGRPILVGTRSVKASEHLSTMLTVVGLEHQVLNAVRHKEEAQVVAEAGQPGRITVATNMAGRGTDIKLGRGIAELGGLHVIVTERHEAGRIDRQLYGRAGRQGDPGSASTFASFEDELVVRHAPRLARRVALRYAGRGEGEITDRLSRWVLDVAQKRAERMALRQRKGVLRNDDWLDEFLGFAGFQP